MNRVLGFFNKISGLMIFLIFLVVFMEHIHHAHHWFRSKHEHFKRSEVSTDSIHALKDSVYKK
jgi:uncharacterized membrane protein